MKRLRCGLTIRLRNFFVPQPKVLLWSLWRSGTHWVADMLSDMLRLPSYYAADETCDYGQETRAQLARYPRGRILVRHLCLPPEGIMDLVEAQQCRVIFLFRDPRDVITSNVNMRKYREGRRPGMLPFPDLSIDEILDWELEHRRERYTQTLPQWLRFEHPLVFKLRYERLVTEPFAAMRRTADFLSVPVTNGELKTIVAANDFQQKSSRRAGEELKSSHYRKGVIGDHKIQFNAAQQQRMNRVLADVIQQVQAF